jgi:hypothetical protein
VYIHEIKEKITLLTAKAAALAASFLFFLSGIPAHPVLLANNCLLQNMHPCLPLSAGLIFCDPEMERFHEMAAFQQR